ncbi:hypothetical protein HZB05_02965 [Candidatus Wolfebacteria bacterium]|nr:hypothetical protein [Candidatus Wolfebacteria bacterium]
MKPVLSKRIGWILLTGLVFLDAFFDLITGARGSPFWNPVANFIGIKTPLLAPLVVIIIYFAVKIVGWIVQKTDKTPRSEELVLTTFVVVYGFLDIWLVAVDFFNFTLIKDHRVMIIPLMIIGWLYSSWAQRKLKITAEG